MISDMENVRSLDLQTPDVKKRSQEHFGSLEENLVGNFVSVLIKNTEVFVCLYVCLLLLFCVFIIT